MMLCKKPYMAGAIAFGCGQCLHCRISRARQWQYRQILESLTHDQNCFITLTYSRQHIRGDWSLDPRHLQLFFKRLRKALAGYGVRYFACGEYGPKNMRPHYHINLFGMSEVVRVQGKPFAVLSSRPGWEGMVSGGILHDCWPLGNIHIGEFNHVTAGYLCGYVTKVLGDRAKGIDWNYPEFARMSLKPGLGAEAIRIIGASLVKKRNYTLADRDVPSELRFGATKFALGRYLLSRLREEVGFAPDYSKRFRDQKAYEVAFGLQTVFKSDGEIQTFREAYLKASKTARASQQARALIFQQKRSL